MRRLTAAALFFGCVLLHAQRGGGAWSTSGGDAQRSFWIRTDPKISEASVQKGFQLVWQLKLNNQPRQLNGLTPPALIERYIGYRGFRALAFVGGSSDNVFAIDTDYGRIEWQKQLPSAPRQGGSVTCPGGMTSNVARSIVSTFPVAAPAGRGGAGRSGGARSGVGEPDQGAVTLSIPPLVRAPLVVPGAPGVPGAPPLLPGRGGLIGGFGRVANFLYVLSGDGTLHSMYVSNGDEPEPPLPFVPPNASAQGLIVVNNVAYAVTADSCGGAANGVWALDLASKDVTSWKPDSGNIAGSAGPAIGPDGTLYVATSGGKLVALQARTLEVKDVYAAGQEFSASPVIFQYKDKTLIAAATNDGRVHLADTASLGGAVYKTPADSARGELASWQDAAGARWILAPTRGAIVAWKVVDQDGALALEPGWTSHDIVSPLTPLVVNGVVFAVSSGAAPRAQRATPAIVYALDAATGKELWNSGKTITSFVHGGGLSAGGGQLYLGTNDGAFYAFGFPLER